MKASELKEPQAPLKNQSGSSCFSPALLFPPRPKTLTGMGLPSSWRHAQELLFACAKVTLKMVTPKLEIRTEV